ncbi:MAG TPA: leucyl aminopeptidase [Euzebyales bacterium]
MTDIRTAPTTTDAGASVVACFVAQDEDEQPVIGRDLTALAEAAGVDIAAALDALHLTGAVDEVGRVPVQVDDTTALVLAVGVGDRAEVGADALRRGAAAAARQATRDATLAVIVPGDVGGQLDATTAARAVAEGAGLGAYAYTTYRTKNHDAVRLDGIVVVPGAGVDPDAVERGVRLARVIVDTTSIARDLINTPPAFKRPPDLADRVVSLTADTPVTSRVLAADELEQGGFGGLIGVGRGSSTEPRLVELTYAGTADDGDGVHVVLVGKGITFDSGGLSLKPSASMSTMKSDMSGAAAVVGTVLAAARLGVAPRVTGLLALAENMPGGDATRVSDVLTHRNGTTVEVMNTDAEGRLVLADALAYGVELEPDAMVDLATLTGGQIVALGNRIAALMGSDDDLLDALEAAAGRAGERLWRLPLPADYREQLRSEVADLRNIGKPREAQSIVAGLFLSEFVGDVPWAHLDIAGPAFSDSGDGPLVPKGATGFGVRTLVAWLEALS